MNVNKIDLSYAEPCKRYIPGISTEDKADDYAQKGIKKHKLGYQEDALNFAKKAIALVPSHHKALELKARIHFENRDYFLAEEMIEIILNDDPSHTGALLLKAANHFKKNEESLALEALNHILKDYPTHVDASLLRAEIYIKQHEWDLAFTDLKNFREVNAKADILIAKIAFYFEEFESVREHIELALRIDSECSEAFILRAKVAIHPSLVKNHLAYKQAYSDLQEALVKDPANEEAFDLLRKIDKIGGLSPLTITIPNFTTKRPFSSLGSPISSPIEPPPSQLPILHRIKRIKTADNTSDLEKGQKDLETKKLTDQSLALQAKRREYMMQQENRSYVPSYNTPLSPRDRTLHPKDGDVPFNLPIERTYRVLTPSNSPSSTHYRTKSPNRDASSYNSGSSKQNSTKLFSRTSPYYPASTYKQPSPSSREASSHSNNHDVVLSKPQSFINHVAKRTNSKKRLMEGVVSNKNNIEHNARKRKVNNADRKWHIDPKYFNEDNLQTTERVSEQRQSWQVKPNITLRPVSEGEAVAGVKRISIRSENFTGAYFSTHTQLPSIKKLRNTFVMAGRGENALAPLETNGGRIILVVPKKDEEKAKQWVTPHCDVLSIHSLKDVDPTQLGLVTSRRLATLSFALEYGLEHLLMIDDNLKKLYASSQLPEDDEVKSWGSLYELFQATAERLGFCCLSAKTYNPRDDRTKPDASECTVQERHGSKIFFLNTGEIFKKIKVPHFLFPNDPTLCCEDGFMQYALFFSGFNNGTISRKALIFKRSKALINSCKKTIAPIDAWFKCDYENKDYPDFVLRVYKKMCEEISRNKSEYKNKREKQSLVNLGASTFKSHHKRKLSTFEQLEQGDDELVSPKKRKQTDYLSLRVSSNVPLYLSNKSSSVGFKGNFITDLQNFIASGSGAMKKNRIHQRDALVATLEHLKKSNVGHFDMATGTGKSRIILLLALIGFKSRQQSKQGVLILTPQLDLIGDTYTSLEEINEELDPSLQIDMKNVVKMGSKENVSKKKWVGNNERKENGKIVISCDISWKNFVKDEPGALDSYPLIILDEFHSIGAELIESLKRPSSIVLGFSATPGPRAAILDPHIFSMDSENGVEAGALCPWVVGKFDMDYSRENLSNLFKLLSQYIKSTVHPHGGFLQENKGMIFVEDRKQAQELEKIVKANGLKAGAIYTGKSDIEGIKENFRKAHKASIVNVLIAVDMAKKGFDAHVDYVLYLKKHMTEIDGIQIRGRALRNQAPTFEPSYDDSDESFDQEFSNVLLSCPEEPTDDDITSLSKKLQYTNCFDKSGMAMRYKGGKSFSEKFVGGEAIKRGKDKIAYIVTFRDTILPENFNYSRQVRTEGEFGLPQGHGK